MSGDPFAEVAATLAIWERDRDLSGCCLMTRGGETLFEASWGFADIAARTPDSPATRFGLASLTKMFTAVVVGRWSATGAGLRNPGRRRPAGASPPADARAAVSVHHLLCHTSGIADYSEEDEDSAGYLEDYAALWIDRPSYLIERPADFLPLFADRPPYRPPGQAFQYCNAGYILLGLVIEQVDRHVRTRGCPGAGLRPGRDDCSGFFRLDEAVPDVATGYLPRLTGRSATHEHLQHPGRRRLGRRGDEHDRATWTGSSAPTRTARCSAALPR